MSRFIIQGGRPIEGVWSPVGNKNAALPMLAASLLTNEPLELLDIPDIEDVRVMLELLEDLGVTVTRRRRSLRLCAASLKQSSLRPDLCRRVRGSILFAGPLLARHGRVSLPAPGGDVIGRRRLDTHFQGLAELGARYSKTAPYRLSARELRGAHVLLDEASVTATENLLLAAALARGTTVLYNAACEPHVRDLGALLNKMGARISGLGSNRLTIRGVKRLHGVRHRIAPDLMEIGSFLAAAAVTGGALEVKARVTDEDFAVLNRGFSKFGIRLERVRDRLRLPGRQTLYVQSDLGSAIPKIEDGPWPSLPSDLMSILIVVASQAEGSVLFFEKMFESRMYFVDQLIGMGARIIQCDPHRVVVSGPSRLHGTHISSPDIRAGMSLIVAALCAGGESVVDQAQVIDRGYFAVDKRLRALGADIERRD